MKLSEIKEHLNTLGSVNFQLENKTMVPEHFHVTEVGIVTKHFIDCGGTVRKEKVANFQLWNADDHDHRLKPQKLLNIIRLSERVLGMEDLEIEVEYQTDTISKYHLDFNGENFVLISTHTDCLAKDNCGLPTAKKEEIISTDISCCTPGGGCC